MKKVLSTVLALGLTVGAAATASAAYDSFSIRGYYQVEGDYATNMTRSGGVDLDQESTSSWYYHKFRAYPTLKVNDNTTVKAEVRLLHYDWGAVKPGTSGVDWDKLWLEYKSPVGMFHIGTTPWGSWGTSFGNSGSRMDAIKFFPNAIPKPFTCVVFTGKISEMDSNLTGITDQDSDYYEGRLGYKADGLETQFGLGLLDNQTNAGVNVEKWRFRGYAKTTMAGLNIEAEFDKTFGDSTVTATGASSDYDALAVYAHVGGQAGNLGWGVLGWMVSGNDINSTDMEAYGHAGTDFEPLLIVTGDDYGMLQPDTSGGVFNNVVKNAGTVALGAYVSMPVSDKLTLTTVVGSAWADEEDNMGPNIDDHYGWEIDLKADYKLLDNLTYSLNFGYYSAGDAVDDLYGTMPHEDSVTLVNHTLNMTF